MSIAVSELADLERQAMVELAACPDEAALRTWHTQYFGKTGAMVLALRRVGEVPAADRKAFGQEANRVKESLTKAYEVALAARQTADLIRSLAQDKVDITL